MTDEVEYGARGILGLLVPQANTTAELEVQAMMAPDVALLTGRLVSPAPDLGTRLDDYLAHIDTYIASFGNAPLHGIGFLITGSTYHMSPAEEDDFFAKLSEKYGYPIVSAGQSIRRAFTSLDARCIALVSPYPEWLTAKSAAYWQRAGVEIAGIEAPTQVGGFHNIYTLRGEAVLAAARRLAPLKADVILLAGAGMPTFGPIMRLADEGVTPISSNFCMGWQLRGMRGEGGSPRNLLRPEAAWRRTFAERFPRAVIG
jgi:maleate isomerase